MTYNGYNNHYEPRPLVIVGATVALTLGVIGVATMIKIEQALEASHQTLLEQQELERQSVLCYQQARALGSGNCYLEQDEDGSYAYYYMPIPLDSSASLNEGDTYEL